MLIPGPRIIDEEKATKKLNEIINSLNDMSMINRVSEYINPDGTVSLENLFNTATVLAFSDCSKPVPEAAQEYVVNVFLDEIELDNIDAMLNLGVLYYSGRIGEQNYELAVKYYQMAYNYGSVIAAENLGYCYYYGRAVDVDYEKAYHYFIKAAMLGRTEAIYKIGDMYAKGLYVEKDECFAFEMYEKALKEMDDECDVKGDVFLRMGNSYYYGSGTERNIHTALLFYQHAEYNYYQQIKNGDFCKKKMLDSAIEKIDQIREELQKKNELMSVC